MGKKHFTEEQIAFALRQAESGTSVPFALSGGDWQDITVSVPAEGRFGILRVYLPATNQPVDVNWIEFGRGKQAAPRRWDF